MDPSHNIRLIIADNDDLPSAEEAVRKTAADTNMNVFYIHAPARNISIARNACLEAVKAPYVAFIDDDELVTKGWLRSLMLMLNTTNADIIVGPVKAIYDEKTPVWVTKGDFHSIYPVFVDGEIRTGASNNILMRYRPPIFGQLRFREELGRSGGEDTLFFHTAWLSGAKFEYAPEAVVTEYVPENRSTLKWLIKRRFRYGQTHGSIVLADNSGFTNRIKNISLSGAKGAFCLFCASVNFFRADRMLFWILRGTLHLGAVARLTGKSEVECY